MLDNWYAEIFLGYDQDYYNESIKGNYTGFNTVRVSYTKETRLVEADDVITNIVLRKPVSDHTVKK